ncbi:hypothetical protein V6O07_04475, partial [Arthrospira platensis SPKY2]
MLMIHPKSTDKSLLCDFCVTSYSPLETYRILFSGNTNHHFHQKEKGDVPRETSPFFGGKHSVLPSDTAE